MSKGRLEAFSDGVLAIVITIMVLELKTPHDPSLSALRSLVPVFLSYVLSFVYVGIYWNNHHHLLQVAHRVNGRILWANLHLLFWISLIPFVTSWIGETRFASLPMAGYGLVMLMAAAAYLVLAHTLRAQEGPDSNLARALGHDWKGKISILAYATSIPAAFIEPLISGMIFVAIAVLWLVPDRRIEKTLTTGNGK